jgi:hypothetical protein
LPRNSEVQNRLAQAVHDLTERAGVTLDADAQERIGMLIGEAAARMEDEGALADEQRITEAEKAFLTLIRASLARSPKGLEKRGGREAVGPSIVKEAALLDGLRGICPIWPIC